MSTWPLAEDARTKVGRERDGEESGWGMKKVCGFIFFVDMHVSKEDCGSMRR